MKRNFLFLTLIVFLLGNQFFVSGCGSTLGTFFPDVTVATTELNFEATVDGDDPAMQEISVNCTYNDGSLLDAEDCELTFTTEEAWIDVYPTNTLGQDTIEVTAIITDLEPGTYQGNIHIESEFELASDDESDITVNLTVSPAS